MAHLESSVEFIAIFDTEFMPEPTFLLEAIPYMGPNVGYAQSRWSYSNASTNLLTKAQQITLNYRHFCEQLPYSHIGGFTFFLGSAGVWSAECIKSCGGWASGGAEDIELSTKMYINGWNLVVLTSLTCDNDVRVSA